MLHTLTLQLLHGLLQIWLIVLLVYMARASAVMRLSIGAAVALLTVAALPARLWKPQLKRLGLLALIFFCFTAIGSGMFYTQRSLSNVHLRRSVSGALPRTYS